MEQLNQHILSVIIFLPAAGSLLILLLPGRKPGLIKSVAFIVTLLDLIVSIPLFMRFDGAIAGVQFAELAPWFPAYGIGYHLGVDGLGLMMVMMTTVLMCSVVLYSTLVINKRVKEFFFLLLLLTTGMLGVFCSRDLFLFYVFWEITLVPMYFLIGIWGSERRIYAAVKFFLFTMAGSVLMLVGILYLAFYNQAVTGTLTFDLQQLFKLGLPPEVQTWLFLAFAISFAIKVPLFPFHTWLPVAHVEAPTPGSMVLAGVLLKLGTYGLVRFCIPLFPQAAREFWPWIATLAVIGIIYGGLVAMVQPDLKKLIAYSSISHLGFVVLGSFALTTQGLSGSILQMVNHGINSAALFMAVGVLYERRHTKLIADFGGIVKSMPLYAAFFMLFMLGSIGVPLTNGFVGEFLVVLGVFRVSPLFAVLAALGVIISAMYMLRAYQRVFFGVPKGANAKLPDLCPREILAFLPLAALVLILGFFPNIMLDKINANVGFMVQTSSLPHLRSNVGTSDVSVSHIGVSNISVLDADTPNPRYSDISGNQPLISGVGKRGLKFEQINLELDTSPEPFDAASGLTQGRQATRPSVRPPALLRASDSVVVHSRKEISVDPI